MTRDEVASVLERLRAAVNTGSAAAIDALFGPGFVDHDPWPGHSPDLAGFKAGLAEMRASFPDLQVEVLRTVAEGDLLTLHLSFRGTQRGPFMGAPASGKAFKVAAMEIVRLQDGRIVEHWGLFDAAGMAQQLGL